MSTAFVFEDVYGAECLKETHLPWPKYAGKVRDVYDLGTQLLFICTDRLSAFDRNIALIPHKGEALNQLSAWWFNQTQKIIANHMIKQVAPQAMLVQKCQPLAIEVVVRGYITGTTNTSMWTLYAQGQRDFFGARLPDGLQKNERLPTPMLTPTSKDADHDRPLEVSDIKYIPNMTEHLWQEIVLASLRLYNYANDFLASKGLILVDTKYEFGLDQEGKLMLIDEIHTSDSSRYWEWQDWQESLKIAREPKNFDKELLRLWYRANTNPYEDAKLPAAPEALVNEVSQRYLDLFKRITGEPVLFGSPGSLTDGDLRS